MLLYDRPWEIWVSLGAAVLNHFSYLSSSVSGQNKSNPVLPFALLRKASVPQGKTLYLYNKSLLIKFVWSICLNVDLVLFLGVYGLTLAPLNSKQNKTWPKLSYPVDLTPQGRSQKKLLTEAMSMKNS